MSDPATTAPVPATDPTASAETPAQRCPWCSELLPASAVDRCPSCNANLVARSEERLPGLTEVEAPTTTKARRAEAPKKSKLLSWISGDIDDASLLGAPTPTEALEPPSKDVRREIWRLTLEAEGLNVAADGAISMPARPAPTAVPDMAAAADQPTADEPTAVESQKAS